MLSINIVKHNTGINLTTRHFSHQSHSQSLENLREDSSLIFHTQKQQLAGFYCIVQKRI